jgi:hypothetical protein
MSDTLYSELLSLGCMTVGQLRDKYHEVFQEPPRSRNKDYLRKRVAYRIQELKEGGISERAARRATELARDSDLRSLPPKGNQPPEPFVKPKRDKRLPAPGAVLKRSYQGVEHSVRVLEGGFEYENKLYSSLSSVAREITGTKWNGFAFFGLDGAKS